MTMRQWWFLVRFLVKTLAHKTARLLKRWMAFLHDKAIALTDLVAHWTVFKGSLLGIDLFNVNEIEADGVIWLRDYNEQQRLTPMAFRLRNRWIVRRCPHMGLALQFKVFSEVSQLGYRPARMLWKPAKIPTFEDIEAWNQFKQLQRHA